VRLQIIAFLFDFDCDCGVIARGGGGVEGGDLEKSEGPKMLDSGYSDYKKEHFSALCSFDFGGLSI